MDEKQEVPETTPMSSEGEIRRKIKVEVKESEASGVAPSSPVCLKRELGVVEAIAIIMGSVIGSGIFVAPAGVVSITGSVGLSLVVWAVCGVCTTMGAMCFAELGTMFPDSGGLYSYLHKSFGPLPAFLSAWVWLTVRNSGGTAIVALTFSSYLVQSITGTCYNVPRLPVMVIAILLLTLQSWMNCLRVRWVGQVQKLFVVSKLVALTVIVIVGVVHLARGHISHYHHAFSGSNWAPAAIATACFHSFFTYNGWEQICNVVEELKNNNRDTPVAILSSMSLLTLIYVLTNVAYLAILTPQEMVASDAVALTFGNRALGVMAWVMPVFVLCSAFGTINGNILARSRMMYVVARSGQLPYFLSLLHIEKATPVPSIILTSVMASVFVTTSGIRELIQHCAYASTLIAFSCVCALLWLRYKEPDRIRPYKVHLAVPVMYTLVQLLLLVLPIIYSPASVGISIGLIASGLPVYYLFIHRQDLQHKCSPIMSKLTYCCQCLFLSVPGQKAD